MIKVFRTVGTDDDAEYRITDDLRIRDAVHAYLAKPIYTLEPVNPYATA